MKEDCQIIRDLLIGYKDNTLNEASKVLVKNHLETCNECQKLFNVIQEEKEENIDKQAIDGMEKVNKKIKVKNLVIKLVSVILIFIVIFLSVLYAKHTQSNNMEIFLEAGITEEQTEIIKKEILSIDKNAEIKYISKEETLDILKKKLNSNLLDGYNESNNVLPASLVLKVKPKKVEEIKNKIIQLEGVKSITTNVFSMK